jgi:hypothetical protein
MCERMKSTVGLAAPGWMQLDWTAWIVRNVVTGLCLESHDWSIQLSEGAHYASQSHEFG